jgi:hypothetical protein
MIAPDRLRRDRLARQSFSMLANPCGDLRRLFPTYQPVPKITGVQPEHVADVFERKDVRGVVVKDPLFGVFKKRLFPFAVRAEIILKANDCVFQKREHQHFLGLLVKPPLMSTHVLRLD